MENKVEIYTSPDNSTEIRVQFDEDAVWLSQEHLTSLFCRDQSVISQHIQNISKEGELDLKSNMQKKMHILTNLPPTTTLRSSYL